MKEHSDKDIADHQEIIAEVRNAQSDWNQSSRPNERPGWWRRENVVPRTNSGPYAQIEQPRLVIDFCKRMTGHSA